MGNSIGKMVNEIANRGNNEPATEPTPDTTAKAGNIAISVLTPEPFNGVIKTKMTTTRSLSEKINELFRPYMKDYYGCTIVTADTIPLTLPNAPQLTGFPTGVGNNSTLTLILYFKDNGPVTTTDGEDSYKCLVTVGQSRTNTGNRIINSMDIFNVATSPRMYNLTTNAKTLLTPFIEDARCSFDKNNNRVPNWNQVMAEVPEATSFGQYNTCVSVRIDLLKVIKEIYKTKINNHYLDYAVNLVRINMTSTAYGAPSANHIISITQLDNSEVESLCKETGFIGGQTSLMMVRA